MVGEKKNCNSRNVKKGCREEGVVDPERRKKLLRKHSRTHRELKCTDDSTVATEVDREKENEFLITRII